MQLSKGNLSWRKHVIRFIFGQSKQTEKSAHKKRNNPNHDLTINNSSQKLSQTSI